MSASFEKAERKYLDTHAEPEVALCGALDSAQRGYGHVLAIPAAGEADELERTLASLPDGPLGPVLTIVVVNATPDAPAWVQQSNAQTLETFGRRKDRAQRLTPRATLYAGEGGDVLVLDRATRGHQLPPGQGVGLARKIGVDLALALVLTGRVASPWIHVSDADVRFPEDYFHQVLEDRGGSSSALLYRFQHRPIGDARSYDAALQYEAALRYYVTGLRFAGSRYAFHSIGSTLVLRASAYAQVRGFPRRQAAEDFYLLNKIAKVGRVTPLTGMPLALSSRVSRRVPFGTGAAIARMLEDTEPRRYTYHPALFHHLRAWLDALEATLAGRASGAGVTRALKDQIADFADADPAVDASRLWAALKHTGALSSANDALAAPARSVRRRVDDTFDGFRTVKLLHALRDSGFADLPLRDALQGASFLPFAGEIHELPLETLRSRLEVIESQPRRIGNAKTLYGSEKPFLFKS
ncbi:MAG: hypothetical protein HRU02_16845 [Myxococcales bacterium]|nr:hypothetical protein [Myxococcales bacterium]